MTVAEALRKSGLDTADTEILLADLFEKDRTWLLAHPEAELDATQQQQWTARVTRRAQGEPVALITGWKEFYGRRFAVNPSTLIPRPATEGLVSLALEILERKTIRAEQREIDAEIVAAAAIWKPLDAVKTIVDIGTGSGCIAITLALELPTMHLIATDSSNEALTVAQANAQRLGVSGRIQFLEGNLLEPLQDLVEPFVIVSNPPYIPQATVLERDVADYEPHTALFGGPDGADVIRALIKQAKVHPQCCGLIVECRKEQAKILEELA